MISRIMLVKLLMPIVFVAAGVVVILYFAALPSQPNSGSQTRDNSLYAKLISTAYPAMEGRFNVTKVGSISPHWFSVDITNKYNGDRQYALVYDPINSSAGMQLIFGPSTRSSFDEIIYTSAIKAPESSFTTSDRIPGLARFESLPAGYSGVSDYNSIIAELPTQLSLGQSRDIQQYLGYLINHDKKNAVHLASYRSGSLVNEPTGVNFLVDVPAAKSTYRISAQNSGAVAIDCALPGEQKSQGWACSIDQTGGV